MSRFALLAPLVAALALPPVFPAPASAERIDLPRDLSVDGCRPPVHWVARHPHADIRRSIVTNEGGVALVLTSNAVAFQLSDATMARATAQLRESQRRHEDNAVADAFVGVVVGGVRVLLEHGAECALHDLREVTYHDGRLHFVARDGSELFESFDADDRPLLENFPARDAEAFARAVTRELAAGR